MRRRVNKSNNYAFIDSQNLNLGIQKMGWKLDWSKFRQFLKNKYGVSNAYLFIGYLPEYEEMYNQLHDQGYLIVLKPTVGVNTEQKAAEAGDNDQTKTPVKQGEATEERKPTVKGNIDAELVLYAMKEINNYDKALIVSGDGDFYCLAEYLTERNKLLHIMTPNWRYSSLLKPYERFILRLDRERRQLAYRGGSKPKPKANV